MLVPLFAALLAGQTPDLGPAAEPPPAAQSAPAQADAAQPVDTVHFLNGGRVRGTVLEETSHHDVTIRLLDGTIRRYGHEEIARIEYADGTVSRRRTAPPPAPAPAPPRYAPPPRPAYPPPPAYAPPPPYQAAPAVVAPRENPPIVPLWGSIGVGATFFAGDAERGLSMSDELEPQIHFAFDGGVRITPAFGVGVYMDVGAGDPGRPVREACTAQGLDCTGYTGRIGLQLRHTWEPASPAAKWLSIGTGWEFASLNTNMGPDLFNYTGREYFRLAGGVDFRSNAVIGVGLYGSIAWGEYTHLEDSSGVPVPMDGAIHTTIQAGVRLTLFP